MGLLDKIKYGIDIPRWQQITPALNAHAAGVGFATDKRVGPTNLDIAFQLVSATAMNVTYLPTGASGLCVNPGITAFGAGSNIVVTSALMYTGTIGAGSTQYKVVSSALSPSTSQSLDSMVLSETMATGVIGFWIRIKTTTVLAISPYAGRTEERMITSNTSGTTPTFFLNAPLTGAPQSGDTFEIIGIRVWVLGTTAGATQWRMFDSASQAMTSKADTTLAIATDSSLIALDENYTPYDRKPGEGFLGDTNYYDNTLTTTTSFFDKRCLVATAASANSITGQASGGDATVLANEYRNFQIRIVEDIGANCAAVGQRAIIVSHTAGPSPVYTINAGSGNWTTTPSSNAKFVIELPNQIILFAVQASNFYTYTYNPTPWTINNGTGSIATNTWSTTYYGARSASVAAGCFTFPCWAHEPTTNTDGTRNSRHSFIYSFRGGSTTLDLFDIAGGTTGAWTANVSYNSQLTSFSTGSCGDYAPYDQLGQWGYCLLNTTGLIFRFNVKNRSMYPWPATPTQSGTAAVGERLFVSQFCDTATYETLSKIHVIGHLSTTIYRSEAII